MTNGTARQSFTVPTTPGSLGLEAFTQVLAIDGRANPAGGTMSNGIAIRLGGR